MFVTGLITVSSVTAVSAQWEPVTGGIHNDYSTIKGVFLQMGYEIYLNIFWLVPLVVWLATRKSSQIFRSTIVGVSFGLVVSYASVGLYALHLAWPISETLGQLCFYFSFFHDLAGVRVAIFFHLISAHTPIADDQRLLLEVVNSVSWAIAYGVLGLLWGYFRNSARSDPGGSPETSKPE